MEIAPSPSSPARGEALVSYLHKEDGAVEILLGPNLCFPRFAKSREEGLAIYQHWIRRLADQGGNFFRLWLGHPFFDIEPGACGIFLEEGMQRLEAVLAMANDRGMRAKITIDFFRSLDNQSVAETFPGAPSFARPALLRSNGGVADHMDDYLSGEEGRRHFLSKLEFLARRFAGHPAIESWELWNEMNAVASSLWRAWTETMLPELRRRFPGTRILQSLGSYDRAERTDDYVWLAGLPDNDVLQVHRYVDEDPATWPVCHGPVDVMAASAIWELRSLAPGRPVTLAESGMVEPSHTGPSRHYANDVEGTILHDILFAPFFAGAAEPGQMWHWDFYLDQNNLWPHYRTFRRFLEGVDFKMESFTPAFRQTPSLRIYELAGRRTRLFWLRDGTSDWRTELRDGIPAAARHGEALPFFPSPGSGPKWEALDPWSDDGTWHPLAVNLDGVRLPPWRRSLLLRSRD